MSNNKEDQEEFDISTFKGIYHNFWFYFNSWY